MNVTHLCNIFFCRGFCSDGKGGLRSPHFQEFGEVREGLTFNPTQKKLFFVSVGEGSSLTISVDVSQCTSIENVYELLGKAIFEYSL